MIALVLAGVVAGCTTPRAGSPATTAGDAVAGQVVETATPATAASPTRTATPVTPSASPSATAPAPTATPTPVPPTSTPTSTSTPSPIPPTQTHTATATATLSPSATWPPPSRTPVPAATATHPPPTNTPPLYRFVAAGPAWSDPSFPCPGCPRAHAYIVGHVHDAAGNPLVGVRLVCYNDWHRYPVVASKAGGEYDFAIIQADTTWYVVVLDQSDRPISPEVAVRFDLQETCRYILDWRRVD
jgi:hypothetical protein